jgi:hypothetical protein
MDVMEIVIGVAGVVLPSYLLYQQNRILARQGPPPERTEMRRYWPLFTMAALTLSIWAGVGFDYYDRHHLKSSKPIIIGWGLGQPNTCGAQIDGSTLVGWGSDYRVAIICGISDPALDKLEDTRITITRFFTIPDTQTFITGSFSKEMTDGINNLLAQTIKGQPISAPTPAPGTQLVLQWSQWVVAIVVPAKVEATDIHRLSDVSRLGGEIVDGKQFVATTIPARK